MLMCAAIKTNYGTQARAHTHTYTLLLLRIILALLLLRLLSFMEQSRTIKYPHFKAAKNQSPHFERAQLPITYAPQDPMFLFYQHFMIFITVSMYLVLKSKVLDLSVTIIIVIVIMECYPFQSKYHHTLMSSHCFLQWEIMNTVYSSCF